MELSLAGQPAPQSANGQNPCEDPCYTLQPQAHQCPGYSTTFICYDPATMSFPDDCPTEPEPPEESNNVALIRSGYCEQAPAGSTLRSDCEACYQDGEGGGGAWTVFGCIKYNNNQEAVQTLIGFLLGIAGGFAMVLILYGAFIISISTGNPEKIKQGKEIVTAAIFGLVFIILSVIILQFIGVDVLQIPGFFS